MRTNKWSYLFLLAAAACGGAGEPLQEETQAPQPRAVSSSLSASPSISTISGRNLYFNGDNIPALNATVGNSGVVVASDGTIYMSDGSNRRIRRVATNGIITTLAGTGVYADSGDNGPATSAELQCPGRLALSLDEKQLYVADRCAGRVRRVDLVNGFIYSFAGKNNGTTDRMGDDRPAVDAYLYAPSAVAVGPDGSVYIGENYGSRVRRVATNGIITTVAGLNTSLGGGPGSFVEGSIATQTPASCPESLAVASNNDLYIGTCTAYIIKVTAATKISTIFAGAGTVNGDYGPHVENAPARSAYLSDVHGLALRPDGVYFTAWTHNRVLKVGTDGRVTTVAGTGNCNSWGNGPATSTALCFPRSLAFSSSGAFFVSNLDDLFKVYTSNNALVMERVAGTGLNTYAGDGGAASEAMMRNPSGVTVTSNGTIFIADTQNNRIRRVDTNGTMTTVAGGFLFMRGFAGDGGPATSARLDWPTSVAVASDGTLYISDSYNNRIRRVSPSGIITTFAGTGTEGFSGDNGAATNAALWRPTFVLLGPDGSLYISDSANHRVRKVDTNGMITTVAGSSPTNPPLNNGDGGPATSAVLNYPRGLALGPDGSLYIADSNNNRIRRVAPNGTITTVAGTGVQGNDRDGQSATTAAISGPQGLVVRAVNGQAELFFASGHRIRRVGTNGIISTLAGSDSYGFSGDGGPASSALLRGPSGLALSATGTTLFVADSGNHRIRRLQ